LYETHKYTVKMQSFLMVQQVVSLATTES